MWNKIFLICFLSISIFAEEIVDIDNPMITWSPSEGSTHYILQIKNEEDEITFEIETENTSYKVELEPGKYSHRIGTYNKFGKVSSFSEWVPFIVVRSLAPIVTSEQIIVSAKSEKEKTILIEGKNLYKDTKISIKNEADSIVIKNKLYKKGAIEITIDNENSKEGSYDLILENPRRKILTLNNYYQLGNTASKGKSSTDSAYPYWKQAGKSMLVPGWGQISKDQYPSAIIFDVSLLIAGVNYYATSQIYDSEKKRYSQIINRGVLYQAIDGQDTSTLYSYISSENQYHRTKSAANNVYSASILFASIYTLNILDALLWKTSISLSKNEANVNFYTRLQSNNFYSPAFNSHPNTSLEFGIKFQF